MTTDRKNQDQEIFNPIFPNMPREFNVGAALLEKGQTIVYSKEGLPSDVMIREYPDGRKVLLEIIDGEITETGSYVDG